MNRVKKILASVLVLLLTGALFLPSVIKISHALFEHQEIECKNLGTIHLHESELDCDFHKFNLTPEFYPELQEYSILPPRIIKEEINDKYTFLSKYQKLHFSLRGPPSLS
ncbi:hypothetical protein GGR42_000201 [Saonia flava]|uniref:Uncharacterized protein n=1 Tax=Saonia flava TaxID=523696 RepID=A0A846QYP8_9FLAO|nr:hypothetical protein [Saonia flava]NJB69739.1 hypothetical protein [Saonia flava]